MGEEATGSTVLAAERSVQNMSRVPADDVDESFGMAERAVWQDLVDIPGGWAGCVATIGVFDGFHRGHQELVHRAQVVAAELGVPTVLITFDPHPLEVLQPGRGPRLLATLDERVRYALDAGIDRVFVQQFDHSFAQIPADTWAEAFLFRGLRVRSVVVGQDFRFGAGNRGDVETLKTLGVRHGFDTESVPLVRSGGQRCSSTWLRELRDIGRLTEARDLLGHA